MEKYKLFLERQGISESSVKLYISLIKIAKKRLGDNFTQVQLDKFNSYIREKYKPNYVSKLLDAIKYYIQCYELNLISPNRPKVEKKFKHSINYEFLKREIFEAIEYGDFRNPLKVKCIVMMMFWTGLRKNEYLNLRRDKFEFKKDYGSVIFYIQKTKKDKKILFPAEVSNYLNEYFTAEPERENALNLSLTTITSIFIRLKELCDEQKLHPHTMRSSCITHLYNQGWTVEDISVLIGIAPQTIYKNYLDIKFDEIELKYAKKMKERK